MSGPRKIVVDASVIVKWFVDEDGSDKALRIRDEYIERKINIIVPQLVMFETLNALRYKGLFSEAELMNISEALDAYSFELVSLTGEYAKLTIESAIRNNITVYDSAYVVLAKQNGARLYTADKKLCESLQEEYLNHVENIAKLKE